MKHLKRFLLIALQLKYEFYFFIKIWKRKKQKIFVDFVPVIELKW